MAAAVRDRVCGPLGFGGGHRPRRRAAPGDFVFGPIDLQVDIGDRIAITGPNGKGKSTLLALLLGHLQPDAGTVSIGASVAVGEVDQARGLSSQNPTLLEVFAGRLPERAPAEIRTLLAKFGVAAEHVARPTISLSPGERTRATLALLQATGVNLLVLDEPTNHLDLPAIEQLEQARDDYARCC
jgi:ATPase subunit of ABC transporter with duplicated ATPase domains